MTTFETGRVTFQLVDEDGDELPGRWSYAWSGRDPVELAIYAVTEISGRPWKWTRRRSQDAWLSQQRSRILSARFGNVVRRSVVKNTTARVAALIQRECLRPGAPPPDSETIAEVLRGREVDWDAGPVETVGGMLRAMREVFRAAKAADAGVRIIWGDED